LDDGTPEPPITKEEISTLIELVLRDEPIEHLLCDNGKHDSFKKYDVLSVHNITGEFFFL